MNKMLLLMTILGLVVACQKKEHGHANPNKKANPIEAFTEEETKAPSFEITKLVDIRSKTEEDQWSFPTLYPVGDLLLVRHSDEKKFDSVYGLYSKDGQLVYETQNEIRSYNVKPLRPFLIERKADGFDLFSILGTTRSVFATIPCKGDLIIKRATTDHFLKVSCSDTNFYYNGNFYTEEQFKTNYYGLDTLENAWYLVRPENVSPYRTLLTRNLDFYSPFTEIDKDHPGFLPGLEESSVLKLEAEAGRYVTTRKLTNQYGHIYQDSLALMEERSSSIPQLYTLGYLGLNSTYVFRESLSSIAGSNEKLISSDANFINPIELDNEEIKTAYCKTAIAEKRNWKNPDAYGPCLNFDIGKLQIDRNINIFNKDFLKVDIFFTRTEGRRSTFRGALILDSKLEPVKTYEAISQTNEEMKFLSNGDEMYAVTASSIKRFNQDGSYKDSINFCDLIPGCRRDQSKTVIAFGPKGQFIFSQSLVRVSNINSPELIYVLKIKD